ncbi:MAG: hypothetical protein GWO02_04540 [Gammaproteobacteria bacterium]|nr:hypothetical protein [Gammaproteobacteria bacterium]
MGFSDVLLIWPSQPGLSALFWIVILVFLLYIARAPAHQAIWTLSRILYSTMRMGARSIMSAEERLKRRNREVLLASGAEVQERYVEREFERVEDTLRRNMETYPVLHRRLSDLVTHIDEDYHKTADVPPSPPAWARAVEAIAKIEGGKDPAVATILEDIHKTMEVAHHNALGAYRKASQERHRILGRLLPYWRKVASFLGQFEKRIDSLMERGRVIDKHMTEFEEIRRQTDYAVRTLASSSLTQFFVSTLVLLIAVGGAVINFQLIARPMAEMVGGASRLMGYPTSNVAALVIIFVEVAMGLFLMELLRITRLFPVIRALDDKMRRRLIWVCFVILLLLASIESALAYMRDYLAAQDEALQQYLTGAEVPAFVHRWIPTVAQMVLGFVLPFALVFVAIPLENFVHSFRTVLGVATEFFLRALAFILRVIGNVARYLGVMLVHLYDVAIFAPLWIEKLVQKRNGILPLGEKPGKRSETGPGATL